MTDTVADYLTRIRNAINAKHRIVEIPRSKLKESITEVLYEKGYIRKYKVEGVGKDGKIKIALKYDKVTKVPAIQTITRISKPGLRKYIKADEMPRVMNGLGIAVVSTSRGVITDKEARSMNIGGEVLCYVY